jgi:hypothetical protein
MTTIFLPFKRIIFGDLLGTADIQILSTFNTRPGRNLYFNCKSPSKDKLFEMVYPLNAPALTADGCLRALRLSCRWRLIDPT